MQKKKYIEKITGQSHLLGRWWGNFQTIAQHTNIYVQFLILSFSATSAYGVLSSTLHQWGYQLSFGMFVLLVIATIVLIGIFAWRLSIPSTFATWNVQFWSHGNLLRARMEERDKEIDAEYKKLHEEIAELKALIQGKK